MLYSPYDKYTTQKMINSIREIISTYEPRIAIISVPVEYDEDKHEFTLTVNYNIPTLGINDSYQILLQQ